MNKHDELIRTIDWPLCACDEFYSDHHPECPVLRKFKELTNLLEQYGRALERLASDDHELPVVQPVGTKWDAADFLQEDLNVIQAFAKSTIGGEE